MFNNIVQIEKGDGYLKILQRKIGGIWFCEEIFEKKLSNWIFGAPKLQLRPKKLSKKISKFSLFIRGDHMNFDQIISKNLKDIFLGFFRKIVRVRPYEKWKFWKKICSIFLVQVITWDLQNCILKDFFKNLFTISNASYFSLEFLGISISL